jgi:glycerate dehydrogenase
MIHGDMNIVVLDGFTLNPGDLSWDPWRPLGSCAVYDRTPPAEVLPRSLPADILLTNKTELTAAHLGGLPRLKYIGVLATGTNVVDLAAARARGIPVTNVPGYGTRSVSQATLALLLELTHHTGQHARHVRQGAWSRNPDWCYWEQSPIELDGLTLGLVGFGHIGQAVAQLGAALGLRLLVSTPHPDHARPGVRFVDLETLLRQSDVVSLHCPLTPATRALINAERLAWMKPSAFLLNTSRGALIDEPALAAALNAGRLAGAGLDVLSAEPPPLDHPLLHAANCLITPHLAWATRAARSRLMDIALANLRAFLQGHPQNVVNAAT